MFEQVIAQEKTNIKPYFARLVPVQDLLPTEEINHGRMQSLAAHIKSANVWTKPLLIEEQSSAIMDGHHRYNVALMLGLKRVPCLCLSYDDPNLSVVAWNGGQPYEVFKILNAAQTGDLLDFKTTKHVFEGKIQFEPTMLEALT